MSVSNEGRLPKTDGEDRDTIHSTQEQRDHAARVSSVVLMQSLAKGIRTGATDVSDIVPMIEVIESVAAPVPELAADLARIRKEWGQEYLSNIDVANDLQHNAKRFTAIDASSVKGPAVDSPLLRPQAVQER